MKNVTFFTRLVFGFFLITFGLNKFFGFLPMGELSADAIGLIQGLMQASYLMPLIGTVMILTGLSILMNKYTALMLVVLAPIVLNIVLFNVFYNQEGISIAAIMLLFHVILFAAYRNSYASLGMPCSGCGCSTKKK